MHATKRGRSSLVARAAGPAAMMADKPQDWHMMQRVFVEDLDPERLARARAEHERKNR